MAIVWSLNHWLDKATSAVGLGG